MSVPLSQVLNTARTYLNDDNATQFPDPVLIPKVQEAHRELQEELWLVGSPIVRSAIPHPLTYGTGGLLITPGTFVIPIDPTQENSGLLTNKLPKDFLCPTMIWESPAGGPIDVTPMTEVSYINPETVTWLSRLGVWCWIQEALTIPVVGDPPPGGWRLRINYRRAIPIPQISTDPIGILFGESYLAARSAALAAGSLGNADVLNLATALAKENLSKVISANRGQQKPLLKP